MSNDSLSMVLDNELAAVPRAAERVEAFCSAREIPGRIARRFNLALDEALTNVISHAFPDGGRHAIEVLIELRDGFLTATVIDDGMPFDPVAHADAVICINMIHIAPWAATQALLDGANVLPPGGVLFLYGPFRRLGRHTAASNAAFDAQLRGADPDWGVRDLEAVAALAEAAGFEMKEIVEMPANNLSVVFGKRA